MVIRYMGRRYTDEDIIKHTKEVKSIAGLLRRLGLRPMGGNYDSIKRQLVRLEVNTEHWTGQGWNKNEQLKNWDDYIKPSTLKKILLKDRGHRCESCEQTIWMDSKIPLELEHIDGDRLNNKKENLKLLCCNCHALTNTWRGRKLKGITQVGKRVNNCLECGTEVYRTSKRCVACSNMKLDKHCKKQPNREYKCLDCGVGICSRATRCTSCSLNQRKKFNPSYEELKQKVCIEKIPYTKLGTHYGVSDNAIRKRCLKFNIDPKTRKCT